jgi:hypothetical protein
MVTYALDAVEIFGRGVLKSEVSSNQWKETIKCFPVELRQ